MNAEKKVPRFNPLLASVPANWPRATDATPAPLEALSARHKADTGHSRIEIVAGNDAANLMGAFLLFRAWGMEKTGKEMDAAAWLSQWQAEVCSISFVQLVAWDGPMPVAMCRAHRHYDVFYSQIEAWGDKGYALPGYRGERVWSAMVDAAMDVGRIMGAVAGYIPVGADETAEYLGAMYERRGFVLSGKQYRKEII